MTATRPSALRVLSKPQTAPRSVRISITDRCDLACTYCRPSRQDGYLRERLDLDAWRAMIDGLFASGVERFRITGGEPLLHPDVVSLVRLIAEKSPLDLSLTTNATRLARLAKPLADAGLHRINISLDTLDPARFHALTRGGQLDDVLAGIDAAINAKLHPIKLNIVVLRDVNVEELEALVDFAWARGLVPRFLEVMNIGEGAKHAHQRVEASEMIARLGSKLTRAAPMPESDRGPARYLHARHDPSLRVGFITGASEPYCAECDRLRVSSDGVLRACLARDEGVEASHAARDGDRDAIPQLVQQAWSMKPDGEVFQGCNEASAQSVRMRAIGG